MDDELRAIQDDLDGVLERLEIYASRGLSAYRAQDGERQAELADTLKLYLDDPSTTLAEALSRASAEKLATTLIRNRYIREHGAMKGKLLFAFQEISGKHPATGLPRHDQSPILQPEELATLVEMIDRYLDKRDRFPGEYGKHNLMAHSGKRDEYGLAKRYQAVSEYMALREKHGAQEYPLDREGCQPIAEKYGFAGETLVREVRKCLDDTRFRRGENGGLKLMRLRSILGGKLPRKRH